jgi:hypothetical protein
MQSMVDRPERRTDSKVVARGELLPHRRSKITERNIDPSVADIARIWRGRTRPEIADRYEACIKAEGIPPLEKTALGAQLFREDREQESWFTTISYWPNLEAMTAFTNGEPTKVHHLDHDPEFLIELPEFIQIHRIVVNRQSLR